MLPVKNQIFGKTQIAEPKVLTKLVQRCIFRNNLKPKKNYFYPVKQFFGQNLIAEQYVLKRLFLKSILRFLPNINIKVMYVMILGVLSVYVKHIGYAEQKSYASNIGNISHAGHVGYRGHSDISRQFNE